MAERKTPDASNKAKELRLVKSLIRNDGPVTDISETAEKHFGAGNGVDLELPERGPERRVPLDES